MSNRYVVPDPNLHGMGHIVSDLDPDEELGGVIEGTSDHPGVAANSLIISNTTDDSDIMLAVSDNGNSIGLLKLNGSDGTLDVHGRSNFAGIVDASGADRGFAIGNLGGTERIAYQSSTYSFLTSGDANAALSAGNATFDGDLEFTGEQTISTTADSLIIAPAADLTINVASAKVAILNTTAPNLHTDTREGEALFIRSGGSAGNNNVQAVLAFGKADGSSLRSAAAIGSIQTDASDLDKVGLAFYTSSGTGSGQTMGERLRITHLGVITNLGAAPANVTTAGACILSGGIAFTDVANAWIDDASQGSGTVTHYIGNQSITTSSDIRVKTDWEPWEGSALDVISPAQLGSYRYNLSGGGSQTEGYGPNSRGTYLGFKAQDTIQWAPWIVNAGAGADCVLCVAGEECDEHGYWHVEYQHLVPLLVKAIQELRAEVTALKES